jgi:hypothetical protein
VDRPIDRRRAMRLLAGSLALAHTRPIWADTKPDSEPIEIPEGFDRPDRYGEVWGGLEYQGRKALCQIPVSIRQQNTDGSAPGPMDGLCVIASQVTDGRWVELLEDMERLWKTALARPGGYHPAKMKALALEVVPHLKHHSYEGLEIAWMRQWLEVGVAIGVTLGTGRGYQYQDISHMVSLIHMDDEYVALIDNNWAKAVAWMPIKVFQERFTMTAGYGWAFWWDVLPPQRLMPSTSNAWLIAASALMGLGTGAIGVSAGLAGLHFTRRGV